MKITKKKIDYYLLLGLSLFFVLTYKLIILKGIHFNLIDIVENSIKNSGGGKIRPEITIILLFLSPFFILFNYINYRRKLIFGYFIIFINIMTAIFTMSHYIKILL